MGLEVIAIATAIGSALAAGGTGAFLAGTALWGFTTVGTLLSIGIAVAGGLVSMLVAKTMQPPAMEATEQIRKSTASESAGSRWRVVGETSVAGSYLLYDVSADDELFQLIHVASHTIDGFAEHRLNNEDVTLDVDGWVQIPAKWRDNVQILTSNGAHTSQNFPILTDNFAYWTSEHKALGMALVMVRQKRVSAANMQEVYPGTGRLSWTGSVRGDNNIFDPRDDTNSYTSNAALIALDHLIRPGIDGGCAINIAQIDLESFEVWADACDVSITGITGAAATYESHGILVYGDDPMSTLAGLVRNCDADIYTTSAGLLAIRGSYEDVTADTTFSASNVVAMEWTTRPPAWTRVNRVVARYISPSHNYREITTPPFDRDRDANEALRPLTIDLTYCANVRQAQMLVRKHLLRVNPKYTGVVTLTIAGITAEASSSVEFDFPEAPQVAFRVTRRTIGDDGLTVVLELESVPDGYDDWESGFEKVLAPLPAISAIDGNLTAPDVIGTSISTIPQGGGVNATAIDVQYTPLSDNLVEIDLDVSEENQNIWTRVRSGNATVGIIGTGNLADGTTYDLRLSFRGAGGGEGPYTIVESIVADQDVPVINGNSATISQTDVYGFAVNGTAPNSIYVRKYRIHLNQNNGSFNNATRYGPFNVSANANFSTFIGQLSQSTTYSVWLTYYNSNNMEGPPGPEVFGSTDGR